MQLLETMKSEGDARVALKRVLGKGRPDRLARFQREARLLANLERMHAVGLGDPGEAGELEMDHAFRA